MSYAHSNKPSADVNDAGDGTVLLTSITPRRFKVATPSAVARNVTCSTRPPRGWQGENVIYLGEGKFYGHGIGLGQGEDFVRKLSGEMKEGGRTPSLLNINAHLSTDVLELDLNPGQ